MANQKSLINCENLDENETNRSLADQVMAAFVPQFVLNAIIEMGVLQIIHAHVGSGGLSPAEIATRINTPNPNAPDMLDRMLCLLASYSVVRCNTDVSERRYESSPLTKCFVPDNDGLSLAPLVRMRTNKVYLDSWTKLKEAVFEGETPFYKTYGMHAYEYSRIDPDYNDVFNNAMNGQSTLTLKRVLEKYRGFEGIQRLVDVGGGHGHNIGVITSKYSSIKGINYDLPHVIQNAPHYPGVEHVGGDMFESIPEGDAIFLKWILHNWSDEDSLKVLRNCFKSLPQNGKVIVVENVLSNEGDTSDDAKLVSIMDVTMMTYISTGAKERTAKDFESLAKAAGFSIFKLDTFVSGFWVMELYK